MKKREWIAVGIMLSGLACLAQNQTIAITGGVQGVYGELSEGVTSVATPQLSLQYYYQPAATSWMYGLDLRIYSNSMSPNEEGWLSGYEMSGLGLNLMANARYLITGAVVPESRTGLFRSWISGGLGAHFMQYTNNLQPVTQTSSKTGAENESESVFSGAVGLGMGVQYFVSESWAIQFDFAGQFTGNDELDGIVGLGDANDWPVYAGLGAAYSF